MDAYWIVRHMLQMRTVHRVRVCFTNRWRTVLSCEEATELLETGEERSEESDSRREWRFDRRNLWRAG